MKFEGIPSSSIEKERDAERALEDLLSKEENMFLTEIEANRDAIDNAPTAIEALAIAEAKIHARIENTFSVESLGEVEGVVITEVNPHAVKRRIDRIKENKREIGEGGDAIVVVDVTEVRDAPPEICYKFSKEESTPRGRNSLFAEAKIHSEFYEESEKMEGSRIGVPLPIYVTEIGHDRLIAMEKLPAVSISDLQKGFGDIPSWFDIDEFCKELESFLDHMHTQGLYHRDMHPGNIMIRQGVEEPDDGKMGYVIDFGLSAVVHGNIEPYKKEVAGQIFTYDDDRDIIKIVKKILERII